MTDLEADVDDIDEEKWSEGGVEKGSDSSDVQMGEANGTHLDHPAFRAGGEEQEHPVRMSSRILSVRNGQGFSPFNSKFCFVFLKRAQTQTQTLIQRPPQPILPIVETLHAQMPNRCRAILP